MNELLTKKLSLITYQSLWYKLSDLQKTIIILMDIRSQTQQQSNLTQVTISIFHNHTKNHFPYNNIQMKTTLNSTSNPQNQTMYNLHTKRTLPRDVIKWMQGLDLSYSVKDYRKDMANGFLIGEIISRYEPGRIPMHAFQNSSNTARRDNNWTQLQLFFTKNTLRGVQISQQQYSKIKSNADPQQLFTFVCRLYSICTKRTIQQNAPMLDLPPTQNQNPNLTASYLLRDEGLQKLDSSNIHSNNPSQMHNSGFSQGQRLPTKKIATSVEGGDLVDATGVGIKQQGRKMTLKRKSWNNMDPKEASGQDEDNTEPDRLIFDYLTSIMQQLLPTQDPTLRQLLFPDQSKFTPTQLLQRNILTISVQYLSNLTQQLTLNSQQLCNIILRQINQTWKFFTYFLTLLRPLNQSSDGFSHICHLISTYALKCHSKEPKRLGKVFYDSLLSTIIKQVKLAVGTRKKEKVMGLVYDFSGRDIQEKKAVLARLKDQVGSSNLLYIQWLAVLVKQETMKDKGDARLLDDYIYYAQQYLSSSSVAFRTSALKILNAISKSHCSLVQRYFTSQTHSLRHCRDDPEQIYLLIEIYFNILTQIVQSKQYQSLVKGVGSNNLVKAYNPDNEKNAQQLKSRVNSISQTIEQLSCNTSNQSMKHLSAKMSLSLITQSPAMMHIFLDYIYSLQQKQTFFQPEPTQHEFKSFIISSPPATITQIKEHCNQILAEIILLKTIKGYVVEEFCELINVCLDNLNVKKVNMEFWEDVSMHLVKVYTRLLTQGYYTKVAKEGLVKVFAIYFAYDMKIRELSQWIAEAINNFIANQLSYTPEDKHQVETCISQLNDYLNFQYNKNKNQIVSFIITQISQNLHEPGHNQHKLIYLKR